MMRKTILLAFGVLLAVATGTHAANKAETFSISPMIGGITFEGKQHLDTNPVYGVRLGYNFTKEFGVEALFDYANTEPTLTGGKVDFYRYGGELLYHFFPDNTFVPYVAAGYAAVDFKGSEGSAILTTPNYPVGALGYGVGAKYFLTDTIALRGDVRHLVYRFNGTQQAVEYMAGLYIPFGGVKPVAKPVEPTPAPAPAPVAEPVVAPVPAPVVLPPPAAPSAVLTITPSSIAKGDPASLNWTSQNASKCDIQPTVGSVPPQGSMSVTPAGNTTYLLTCTGEGGTATKSADIAVTVPPPVKTAVVKLCSPTVVDIQFDSNKADIKPQFHAELKKLGDFLTEFPNAKGVIEGHTDNVGDKESNMKLSQRRADSVRGYIIKTFGIAPERLSAKGYGPTKPLADNKTREGKAQNRRIEANFTCDGK